MKQKPIHDENELYIVEYSPSQEAFHFEPYATRGRHHWYEGSDWYTLTVIPEKELFDYIAQKEKEFKVNTHKQKMTYGYKDSQVRAKVLKRDKYRCKLCGRTAEDGVRIVAAHRIARAKGGKYTMNNLFAACDDCNIGMGTNEP